MRRIQLAPVSAPWMRMALCRRDPSPPDFFPDPDDEAAVARVVEFCGYCAVRTDCLAYAVKSEAHEADRYVHGIFGGLTAAQRVSNRHATVRQPDDEEVA